MVDLVGGRFYEAGSSDSVEADLRLLALEELQVSYRGRTASFPKGCYSVEPSLGKLDRVIHFEYDGQDGRFETSDLEGFSELERYLGTGRGWRFVAKMEECWRGALVAILLMVFICYAFFSWGLPALASKVASDVPQSWRVSISESGIESLEKWEYLAPSQLEETDGVRVHGVFDRALAIAGVEDSEYNYELRVFEGKGMGANAFAFPSGLIVATDEFVELCETDDQILAVFLHEIAHVEAQHGVRSLVQKGGVFLVFSMLLGDVSSSISLAEGIPALVMNSQYSQRFELEADRFAGEFMEKAGIGADALAEILILLHKGVSDAPASTLLSTHPSLRERVESLEELETTESF